MMFRRTLNKFITSEFSYSSKLKTFGRAKVHYSPMFPFATKTKTEVDRLKEEAQEDLKEINEKGNELKQQEIEKMIQDRKSQLEEISKEKKTPYGALFATLLISSPIVLGSLGLNIFAYNDMFLDNLPFWFVDYMKYSGLHLCFLVKFY
jgi:hypothetical protein